MQLFYQDKDITDDVDIKSAIHYDQTGGKRDMLEIEFEYSEKWFGWQPEKDDTVRIIQDGYDTGILYANAILPSEGKYKIIATGAKCAARRKAYASYEDKSLDDIMSLCAAECEMSQGLYGISGGIQYPYIVRENEGCAAFLDRILTLEGGRLKTLNGKLRGIGIAYAQDLEAGQSIELDSEQLQAEYIRRNDLKYKKINIITHNASASATDTDAVGGMEITLCLPAQTSAQAGRWARGLLLDRNRRCEELRIGMEFNAGLTALARIDIESSTDANGEWIVDECCHDFVEGRSTALLYRCITTVR